MRLNTSDPAVHQNGFSTSDEVAYSGQSPCTCSPCPGCGWPEHENDYGPDSLPKLPANTEHEPRRDSDVGLRCLTYNAHGPLCPTFNQAIAQWNHRQPNAEHDPRH
jgi:hypothetical protein